VEPIGLATLLLGVGVLLLATNRWGRDRLPARLGSLLIPIGVALLLLGIVLLVWFALSRLDQSARLI